MKQQDVLNYNSLPPRVKLLIDGACLTDGDRDKAYGDPAVNMGCAAQLKAVFWGYAESNINRASAEAEAIDMVLTKLSRIACGTFKPDNYVDMSTYGAIAYEVSDRRNGEQASDPDMARVEQSIDAAYGDGPSEGPTSDGSFFRREEPRIGRESEAQYTTLAGGNLRRHTYSPEVVAKFYISLPAEHTGAFDAYLKTHWSGDIMPAIAAWPEHSTSWIEAWEQAKAARNALDDNRTGVLSIPKPGADLDPTGTAQSRAQAARERGPGGQFKRRGA